jgi:hypothetical protein
MLNAEGHCPAGRATESFTMSAKTAKDAKPLRKSLRDLRCFVNIVVIP